MQIQEKRRFQENSEIDAFIFCTPMRCWKLVGHDLSGYLVYDVLAGEQTGKEGRKREKYGERALGEIYTVENSFAVSNPFFNISYFS